MRKFFPPDQHLPVSYRRRIVVSVVLAAFLAVLPALAADKNLPVPRFVSLRSDKVNVRTGPGEQYPIDWVFTRKDQGTNDAADSDADQLTGSTDLFRVVSSQVRDDEDAGFYWPGSIGDRVWVDKDGNGIRYQMIYSNAYHGMGVYPVPPLAGTGRGGGAGAGGAGAGPSGPPRGGR